MDKEEEKEKIREELADIKDELMDELEEIHDELLDEMEDIHEESEDIKEELSEELDDLEEERLDLLDEVGDIKQGLENLGENAKERIERARENLERLKDKVYKHEDKFTEKIRKKLEKAQKKVAKRINISVDPEMSDEWRDWADDLGASVSELVRKSMRFVKNNIGDIAKLESFGENMEKMGENIEKAVKKSGIEDLGEKLAAKFSKERSRPQEDKERLKKRIKGLLKLQKSIPIEKFSQTLNISKEHAENLIYELAAEGIEGSLENEVFTYTSDTEEVLLKLFEKIDQAA
jgi:predicted HicB family RNase H-like nuclease